MTKQAWLEHIVSVSGLTRPTMGGDPVAWVDFLVTHSPTCAICKDRQRTRKASRRAAERTQTMKDCGLSRGRASDGRVIWE